MLNFIAFVQYLVDLHRNFALRWFTTIYWHTFFFFFFQNPILKAVLQSVYKGPKSRGNQKKSEPVWLFGEYFHCLCHTYGWELLWSLYPDKDRVSHNQATWSCLTVWYYLTPSFLAWNLMRAAEIQTSMKNLVLCKFN